MGAVAVAVAAEANPSRLSAVKRVGLLVLLGVLAWRVLVVGFAGFYAAQGTPEGATAALRWRPLLPEALNQRAVALGETDRAEAGRLWQAVILGNPTDSYAYLRLAGLRVPEQPDNALALAAMGDVLGPMYPPTLGLSANFWFARERMDLGLARWSGLLLNHPALESELFPRLLDWAGSPETQSLLKPMLDHPPAWWDRFFAYAARKAPQAETVLSLYHGRNRGGGLPSRGEQVAVLDRLWAEQLWVDAYMVWAEGLDESARRTQGPLNNGGFDQPMTGIGFDWRAQPVAGVTVETAQTYGTRGGRALHLVFDGRPAHYQHLVQALLLEPGRYRLQGRVRPDGLVSDGALRWMLGCGWSDPRPLARSDSFFGKDDWQPFSVSFEVPETDCDIQVLRLEHTDPRRGAMDRPGGIWFEDLAISQEP